MACPPMPEADVVKLAYTHGLGPCAERHVGSNPTIGTSLWQAGLPAIVTLRRRQAGQTRMV